MPQVHQYLPDGHINPEFLGLRPRDPNWDYPPGGVAVTCYHSDGSSYTENLDGVITENTALPVSQ